APEVDAGAAGSNCTATGRGIGARQQGLALAVRAWRYGGAPALSVFEEEWSPAADSLARARAALESARDEDERPRLSPSGNRWSVVCGQAQLRRR
ncbi:SWF or SNF family helicase, partial [Streptomyces sp. NPDC005485]